eukprot:3329486-Rhodomonas_salina.1
MTMTSTMTVVVPNAEDTGNGRTCRPVPASGHSRVHAALAAPHRRPSAPGMCCSPCRPPRRPEGYGVRR